MAANSTTVDEPTTTTAPAKPKPTPRTQPRDKSNPKKQPPYNVVLLDDQDHTFEYVIDLCHRLFALPPEHGFLIAHQVDTAGRAILLTTTKEHAELKRDQVHALGADWRLKRSKGSMTAVIEPVEE